MKSSERQSDRKVSINREGEAVVVHAKSKYKRLEDTEAHLLVLRERYKISQTAFSKKAQITLSEYRHVERTEETSISSINDKVIDTIGEIATNDDANAVKAVTLLTAEGLQENQRERIKDLIDDSAFEGIVIFDPGDEDKDEYQKAVSNTKTFGETLRKMRKLNKQSIESYASHIGISSAQLSRIELDKGIPNMTTVNLLIDASPFDSMSHPAQEMRLKSQDMNILPLKEIYTMPIGKLVRYLRIAEGLTQKDLADILNLNKSTIANIEIYNSKPLRLDNGIKKWLHADVIEKIVLLKFQEGPITKELVDKISESKFVFKSPSLIEFPHRVSTFTPQS